MHPTIKLIQGQTEEDIHTQLKEDFRDQELFFDHYEVVIQQTDTRIHLNIELDLGGGFEGGYESTSFAAELELQEFFSFHVQREGMLMEIGKWLGMQDVEIGYQEFDEKVRIKTNNADRIKKVFQNPEVRKVIQGLESYDLSLEPKEDKALTHILQWQLEEAILDPEQLGQLYSAFYAIIQAIRNS